jgi:ABC-type Fe3+-hydroxamate transport system substrate-binding protein
LPPVRIISLCPSLTELVFDLGLGQDLVGRTKFCVHPADRVGAVEKLGGTKNPKIDRIIELAPDVVLLNEEENRAEDADALAEAGIHCHVSFPRTVADTAMMVRDIGGELGARDAAEPIAVAIESTLRDVTSRARERAPVRYAYLIWRDPWMTVSGDTFVAAMLGAAGGVNVFGETADRYPTVEPAAIAQAEPDVVLLSSEPFPFRDRHADELSEASGVPRDRFLLVDGELLSWHGSRTARGVAYAESVLAAPTRGQV